MLKCFFTMSVAALLVACCYANQIYCSSGDEGPKPQPIIDILRPGVNRHCGTIIRCYDNDNNVTMSLDEIPYIVIDYLPVLLIFPLVIFFNLNLASGPKHSLLFFYQCVPTAIAFDYHPTVMYCYSGELVWGFFTLHNIMTTLYNSKGHDHIFSLPYLAIGLLKLPFAVLFILLLIAMVRCTACPIQRCRYPWAMCRRSMRRLRQKITSHGSILTGVCSLLLITYGYTVQQSFTALQMQESACCNGTNGTNLTHCPRFCEDIEYLSTQHLPFFVPPVVLLLLLLPIPLAFIYHPAVPTLVLRLTKVSLPRFSRQAPVFDKIQGVYKDNLRFFSGLNMLFLYILWGTFAFCYDRPLRGYVLSAEFMVLLLLHSLCQPYKAPRHNYFHTLFLLNLVAISTTTSTMVFLATFDTATQSSDMQSLFLAIMFALTLLPLLCVILYYVKVWSGHCIRLCKRNPAKQTSINHCQANKSDEDGKYHLLQESLVTSESFAIMSVDTTEVTMP